MIIYGKNTVIAALREDNASEIYLENGFKDQILIDRIRNKKIKISYLNNVELNKLCESDKHQGIAAKSNDYGYFPLESIIKDEKDALILILDGIEDPHNFGAIIRSAEAANVDGIIIGKHNCCSVNSTVAKVSTGAINNIKIVEVNNISQTIDKLKNAGYWIVGAEASNAVDYQSIDYKFKTVLIMGSEGKGISRLIKEKCDYQAFIPMFGKINSLNVSVATGIFLYAIINNRRTNR